ncbi:uncharacterized protein EI90DRAFT_3013282 [Cantharellus anzutake]|uniref:uncharacterized protein n=1 Tax=Cantharellus anzutake TaxID=1750568 RepID=UPI001903608E|nr:uncharacterized protein EI90DRAFT_3013282 [Cantharellus anzutake]KAF8337916.1 hypothetical protein EI90DRAFT_3013282 [Cantharellus anzutake]
MSEPTSHSSNIGTINDLNVLALRRGTPFQHLPTSFTYEQLSVILPYGCGVSGSFATGVKAGIVTTAPSYSVQSGALNLVGPSTLPKGKKRKFERILDTILHQMLQRVVGSLAYISFIDMVLVILPKDPPMGCWKLQPDATGGPGPLTWGPERFAEKIHALAANWTAYGDLGFLNEWYQTSNTSADGYY